MVDWLIVGAGLYGATFARVMTDAGYSCLVLEKRGYIGGNCADMMIDNVRVQKHGGHIFHTNDIDIWRFVNRFAEFYPYYHRVKVDYQGTIYSFPVNLLTLSQIYGVTSPQAARELIASFPVTGNDNLEDWCISQIGEKAYKILVEGYTMKQWGRDPVTLPSSIIKRIPVRLDFNDNYFNDTYQGLPVNGFSSMIETMVDGIEVKTAVDFLSDKAWFMRMAHNVLYTGGVDALYDYDLGALEYRGLVWELESYPGDYLGCATINYTDTETPYTRIVDYAHLMQNRPHNTVIAKEYPQPWKRGDEAYYPICDNENNYKANLYKQRAAADGIVTGGRLADYKYYDMHQAIGAAMVKAQRWINGNS